LMQVAVRMSFIGQPAKLDENERGPPPK
jgi:hypothetical protein